MKGNEECFRVRGIPLDYDRSKAEKHLKHALGLGVDTQMRLRSLAPEPYPSDEQMATVDFDITPTCLSSNNPTRQWNILCDCQECTADDSGLSLTVDAHFRDITVFHWPKEEEWKVDLVAVPGLGGHAFGSFKARGGTEMWLRDYLPKALPGARIFTYGYDSHLAGSQSFQNLGDLGMKLRSAIDRIRRSSGRSTMRKPTVLLGHSLGGIVVKEAILRMLDSGQAQDEEILESITGILFFGVPNQGMEIESLLPMVQNQPNEDLIRTLRHNSDQLIGQSQQFLKRFQGKRRRNDLNTVKIVSFYETQKSPTAKRVDDTWEMNGPHTILVGMTSAIHGRPWETSNSFVRPIDTDHSGLVKFVSRYDEHYLNVLSVLRDHVRDQKSLSGHRLSKAEEECLHSFAFPSQDLRFMSIQTTEGTSTWFTNHESYKKWLNPNDQHALLSVIGHPGVGKSTLMKYAVNRTKQHFQWQAVILSFFFDGKTKESEVLMKSSLGFYQSLLHQILSIRPDLLSIPGTASVLSIFEEKKSKKGEPGKDWEWREEELRNLLSKVLSETLTQTPVFVFIDALDECDNFRHAKDIVEYFRCQIPPLGTISPRLRLCFSCRKYLNPIPANAGNLQVICVEEQKGHKIAIQTAVKENLRVIHGNQKRKKAQTAIIRGANGIFLWAILVCRQAVEMADAGDSTKKIEEMIEDVPREFDHLFENLLVKIPKNRQEQSIKLFQWICYATRSLSIEEMQFALAIDANTEAMSVEQLKTNSNFRPDLHDVIQAVRTISQGLADIRHGNGKITVQLIHHTVHEYLHKSGLNLLESLRCADMAVPTRILETTAVCRGHEQLALSCIKCIQMPIKDSLGVMPAVRIAKGCFHETIPTFTSPYSSWRVKFSEAHDWVDIRGYLPLFLYALSSVTHHMAAGGVKEPGTSGVVSRALHCFGKPDVMTSWNRMLELAYLGPRATLTSSSSSILPPVGFFWRSYHTYPETFQSFLVPLRTTVQCEYLHLPLCRAYKFTKTTPKQLGENKQDSHFVILVPHILLWAPYATAPFASQWLAQLQGPMAGYSRFGNIVIEGLLLILFHTLISSLSFWLAILCTITCVAAFFSLNNIQASLILVLLVCGTGLSKAEIE